MYDIEHGEKLSLAVEKLPGKEGQASPTASHHEKDFVSVAVCWFAGGCLRLCSTMYTAGFCLVSFQEAHACMQC